MTTHTNPTGQTCLPVPGDLFARHQVITGLRALADFLETNPGVPVHEYGDTVDFFVREGDDATSAARVDQVAALLDVPVADDRPSGGHYVASKSFGRIAYRILHIPKRRHDEYDAYTSYRDNIRLDLAQDGQRGTGGLMTATQDPAPSHVLARSVVGWVCGTCGGGGVASDGSTCPDCNGHGHT